MPHLNKLYSKYKKQGLVIIGVHSKASAAKMPDFVKQKGIKYPCAVDDNDGTRKKYAVDSNPDYYLIDRSGKLRFADLANNELDRAIKLLISEKAGKASSRPASKPKK